MTEEEEDRALVGVAVLIVVEETVHEYRHIYSTNKGEGCVHPPGHREEMMEHLLGSNIYIPG